MPSPLPEQPLRVVRTGYGHPDAVRLVAAVQAEYVGLYGSPDDSPVDPTEFEPPVGGFFVGYLDDVPVATGAWRRRDDVAFAGAVAVAEVKRMYVAVGVRRRGLSRLVLAHLERAALAAGCDAMVLETGLAQPEAIALYESAGYAPVPAYGHYACSPLSRSYGRLLRDDRAG